MRNGQDDRLTVIGAGFARTGTASLQAALDRLGYGPTYHMTEVMSDRRKIRQWLAVARDSAPAWDAVFAGYRSTVDFPAAAYWRQLADAYPDAKVILTVRDPQAWYDSCRRTVFRHLIEPPGRLGRVGFAAVNALSPDMRAFIRMLHETTIGPVFDGRIADREHALAVFNRHIDEVQATIPADRLLTYRVGEGWQPLCDFLGVPVPDEPFPHHNDAASFQREDGRRVARLVLGRLLPGSGRRHPS